MAHNVVAYLALFVALGGTAVAAKPLISGADIVDDSVTGADVLESSLATVGDADRLDGRDSTDFLGAAAKAADSDAVDGRDSSQLGAPNTAVHGETAHVNGVVDIGNEGGGYVAFVDVSAGKWLLDRQDRGALQPTRRRVLLAEGRDDRDRGLDDRDGPRRALARGPDRSAVAPACGDLHVATARQDALRRRLGRRGHRGGSRRLTHRRVSFGRAAQRVQRPVAVLVRDVGWCSARS